MGWSNLIFGSRDLNNVTKAYVNVTNATSTFVEPTPQTNTITNYTIITQYSIKKGPKFSGQKGEAAVKK